MDIFGFSKAGLQEVDPAMGGIECRQVFDGPSDSASSGRFFTLSIV